MLKKLIILLLPVLLAVGCTKTKPPGPDNSGTLTLRFHYSPDGDGIDRLEECVGDIRVWAFDSSTELLAREFDLDAEDIARGYIETDDLPDGNYTLVAWGGSGGDITHSFSAVEMTDAAAHTSTGIVVGRTSLSDIYIMLDHELLPGDVHGDIAPAEKAFDDLFHAAAEDIAVGSADKTVDLRFICNAKVLNVTVTGLDNLSGTGQPDVFVVGSNGRYRRDNSIDADARKVRYEPSTPTVTSASMEADIKTLRLDIARHADDPVLLYVRDAAGEDIVAPIDIIATILENPAYNDQEDIDREYEFEIGIGIPDDTNANANVKITIDGWEVIKPGFGIDKL